MKTITKKYLAISIVVIILLIFGTFMFLNNMGNNKTDLAGGSGAPVGGNDGLPIADSDSETSGPDATVGECPQGMVLNEEIGECEPEDKVPDELGPIGEAGTGEPTETDITKNLFPYKESGETSLDIPNKELVKELNGHQAYYRLVFFSQGKKMSFAVGYMKGCSNECYLDNEDPCPKECLDPNNWQEIKRFVPAEYIQDLGGGETRNEGTCSRGKYYGQFVKLNDPNYKSTVTGCAMDSNPLRLDYCNPYGDPKGHRIWPLEQIAIVLP